jgi:hypothetical protein
VVSPSPSFAPEIYCSRNGDVNAAICKLFFIISDLNQFNQMCKTQIRVAAKEQDRE